MTHVPTGPDHKYLSPELIITAGVRIFPGCRMRGQERQLDEIITVYSKCKDRERKDILLSQGEILVLSMEVRVEKVPK